MYTRNHEFFFTQRPFECKFTLEGIRTLTNDKGAFKLGNAKKDQSRSRSTSVTAKKDYTRTATD